MSIKKMLPLVIICVVLLFSGCAMSFDEEQADPEGMISYTGANGYSLKIPADWQVSDLADDTVMFTTDDGQLTATITTELGGVDYYSMKEIKEQLTEKLSGELFNTYEIKKDDSGTKYFRCTMKGASKSDAKLVVDIYGNQTFATVRHYLVITASNKAYKQYSAEIESMIESFTVDFSEEQYLKLMQSRADAAEKAAAADKSSTQNNSTDDADKDADTAK